MLQKIKKSLGPDFLDPSDVVYGYVRSPAPYKPKCDYCGNNLCNGDAILGECPYKGQLTRVVVRPSPFVTESTRHSPLQ